MCIRDSTGGIVGSYGELFYEPSFQYTRTKSCGQRKPLMFKNSDEVMLPLGNNNSASRPSVVADGCNPQSAICQAQSTCFPRLGNSSLDDKCVRGWRYD